MHALPTSHMLFSTRAGPPAQSRCEAGPSHAPMVEARKAKIAVGMDVLACAESYLENSRPARWRVGGLPVVRRAFSSFVVPPLGAWGLPSLGNPR